MTPAILNYTVQNVPRPLEFDRSTAVNEAMALFWAYGYEQTSLDALCEATTLNRSSLYNTFGSKLNLFAEALDCYAAGPAFQVVEPLARERGATALRQFLKRLCEFVASPRGRSGCLFVNTAAEDMGLDDDIDDRVRGHFNSLQKGIERAYQEATEDGRIDGDLRPRAVADWLVTFVRGILISAASGVDSRSLCASIRLTEKRLGIR